MSARLIASCLLTLLTPALPLAAQVRDAAPQSTGTGAIAGTVVTDGEPARPVRRAIVTLNSSDPLVARTTITDDAGRFAFASLPASRYSIGATKRGWVTASYGAKAIGRPGRTLSLAAGERATATLRMARGAVITGTILDQFGQPVSGATMRILKYGYTFNTGERRLNNVAGSVVGPDERGAYRVYGLAPGEYYISVSNTAASLARGRDLHLTSEVDVEEALKAAQNGPAVPMTDVPQRTVGFSQIFYPGATSVAQATPIAVRVGEERSGVDFAVQYSPVARVEGTILSPDGTPTAARVNLVVNDPNTSTTGIEAIRMSQAGPDGRFSFAEIAPGPYTMSAHTAQPGATGERPQMLAAFSDVDVQSDISGLTVTLQESLTVSGVIRYDGEGTAPNPASLRVSLMPWQQGGSTVTISTSSVTTAADGRFTLPGVTPGRYRLSVGPVPLQTSWVVRSATLLGQEALDLPADVRQSITDASIVLTDRKSELTGRVEASAGGSTDYTIVLFSADRAHWVPQSRRILTARTASDGSFTFRNVPPGDYQLAPVDDVEQGEWYDPSFLQRLVPGAIRVTIAEGEKKVQDLKAGGG